MKDIDLLIRDKYDGDASKVTEEDRVRLAAGEPLAYVIGWIPFLGLSIDLTSCPLIPRPETEWWTEQLIMCLKKRFTTEQFSFFDLCAGSGAIGLAIMKEFPNASVSFGEISSKQCEQIRKNAEINALDISRVDIRQSDLFSAFNSMTWDVIATNPPYVPSNRTLEKNVTEFEPQEAVFAGSDGLDLIRRIATAVPGYLNNGGEVWLEADIENIEVAQTILHKSGATDLRILNDQFGRPRVVVSHYV